MNIKYKSKIMVSNSLVTVFYKEIQVLQKLCSKLIRTMQSPQKGWSKTQVAIWEFETSPSSEIHANQGSLICSCSYYHNT